MHESLYTNRKSVRLVPDNFRDYYISLQINNTTLTGYIGNISETGVLALFDTKDIDPAQIPESHELIFGQISSDNFNVHFDYEGFIMWQSPKTYKNMPFYALGIQFQTAFILPDPLYALSIAQ